MWNLAGIGLVVIALLAILVFGGRSRGKETDMAASDSVREAVIPRIDAEAPRVTETATFALG
jgi:hypothetical protein